MEKTIEHNTKLFVDQTSYTKMYKHSLQNPEIFWAEQASKYLTWFKEWNTVLSGDFKNPPVQWFAGAQLNAAYNCLDRHLEKYADRVAILWESDDAKNSLTITYSELHEKVCRFANVLKQYGVQKGDRVCIYLPMIPEAVITMLACARIGAVHCVVFGGFSAESLKTRIADTQSEIVITANEGIRGGKLIPLKKNVDLALQDLSHVRHVIVVKRTENTTQWNERDSWYHDLMSQSAKDCEPEIMNAEDPLFMLHTSGSTGKPKGILHSTGGYLVYAAMTHQLIFNYHLDDIYWCSADVGWITGHSYGVYGPFINAATIVLFEGVPHYPTPSRCWEIIAKYKVNIFYTAPTAIRALRKEGDKWVTSCDRSSLRLLGSVGEPIGPEAWNWYFKVVGEERCPIVDTWWQTETGGIMISPLPGATPLKAGSAAWPFFGIEAVIVDDQGQTVPEGKMGRLLISKPWPGLMQTVYGDHERFIKSYFQEFPGYYSTGDQAYCDQDGYFWISGRSDDVLKISGHRIGTQEIESALVLHPAVSEAAVVGIPDEIKGQHIYAFVTLKTGNQGSEQLKEEILQAVRQAIGAIAVPKEIQWAEGLPKTRSGKIMRRLLRKIANNELTDMGDLSTLADPEVMDALIKGRHVNQKEK
jgi:acetyl-CoA synthetase